MPKLEAAPEVPLLDRVLENPLGPARVFVRTFSTEAETFTLRVAADRIELDFPGSELTLSREKKLGGSGFIHLCNYLERHEWRFFPNNSEINSDLDRAIQYAELHNAFYRPHASPFDAAQALKRCLEREIGKHCQDWPAADLTITKNAPSRAQRFAALSGMGEAAGQLNRFLDVPDDLQRAERTEDLNRAARAVESEIHGDYGRAALESMFGPPAAPVPDLDDILDRIEQDQRERHNPVCLTIAVYKSDYVYHLSKIFIEKGDPEGLGVQITHFADGRQTDVRSLKALMQELERESSHDAYDNRPRWRLTLGDYSVSPLSPEK